MQSSPLRNDLLTNPASRALDSPQLPCSRSIVTGSMPWSSLALGVLDAPCHPRSSTSCRSSCGQEPGMASSPLMFVPGGLVVGVNGDGSNTATDNQASLVIRRQITTTAQRQLDRSCCPTPLRTMRPAPRRARSNECAGRRKGQCRFSATASRCSPPSKMSMPLNSSMSGKGHDRISSLRECHGICSISKIWRFRKRRAPPDGGSSSSL